MLKGIRNISWVNSIIAILCLLNFYLPLTAEAWSEVRTALVLSAGLFILSGPVLLIRLAAIWYFVRVLCYFNALILVLYFVSLIGKGYLFSLPIYTFLFLFFGFYFIGVRGYLNTDAVRARFGIKIE